MHSTPLPSWNEEIDEAEVSARKAMLRRAEKAIETLRSAILELEGCSPRASQLLGEIEDHLDGLRPPEPRRCKEYRRAAERARRGFLGIDPDEVVLYCRCPECSSLRGAHALEQKAVPDGADDAPPKEPVLHLAK